jgi:hypothetical protein
MKSFTQKIIAGLVVAVAVFANPAYALPPDFSSLTASIDYSSVITAMLAIMAALAGVYIVSGGGSMILSKLRGGK